MREKIGVIGLWHLGCVIAASWNKLGRSVIGVDHNSDRVNQLNLAEPPLYEPGLTELLAQGIENQSLRFTTNIAELSDCDIVFLSYDTPVNDDDSCDVSILEKSVTEYSRYAKNNALLIVSSQSPVGLCAKLRKILHSNNPTSDLAYSPENLRLGEAISCYCNPGKVILGAATPEAINKGRQLFSALSAETIPMSLESAELVKHGINSFLATSIIFATHLADICECSNARMDDVVRGIKSDPRIGPKAYLSAGTGFSGGTLGRDLKSLEAVNIRNNSSATLFGTIYKLNQLRTKVLLDRIKQILGNIAGKKICALGLTYKAGTSTLRRSLPLEIVNSLSHNGAIVTVFDPKADYRELVEPVQFETASSVEEAIHGADLALLLTEWPEFKEINWKVASSMMNSPLIYDTKNFLDEFGLKQLGFNYFSMGRGY